MPAVDGVISGFDTSGLIKSITEAALQPAVNMRTRKADYEKKIEKITELSDKLQTLSEKAAEIGQEDGLAALSSTSTTDLIEVTQDSSAVAGNYLVEVSHLSRGETSTTNGYADSGLGQLGHGTLTIDYGGEPHEITIDGTNDGLAAIASEINDIDGLSAVVVDTGVGAEPFQLVVTGETGADNAIDFSFASSGGGGTDVAFTEVQDAQNSAVTVNGIAIESSGDTVEAIPGVTLDLRGVPTGTQTIKVAEDVDGMVEKVKGFVEAYNEVQSFVNTQSVYNAEAGLKGPFAGETSVRRVTDGLSTLISNQYTTGSNLTALSELGIATEKGGTLELDEDKLRELLEDDFANVDSLLTSDTGPLASLAGQIDDVYVDSENGTLESRTDSLQGSIEDLEDSISRQEDYVDAYSERLREKFTAMEAVMAQAQNSTNFLLAMISGDSGS